MQTLLSMESDIDTMYLEKEVNMNMYCFIHLDISNSLHQLSLQKVIFETIDELRIKLLTFYDNNNTNLLIERYIKEGYNVESKYVLFVISNNRYIEFCSWIKAN
jgi:hypothetical protein